MRPCKRRCWECGNVADHDDVIHPYVNCKKCGSQDTRLIKAATTPPPARDWKPGEKVLVEATVTHWAIDSSKYVWVNIDDEHIPVPLSSIRPRKDGE